MSAKSDGELWWYKASIMRNGLLTDREGIVTAHSPLQAMDKIHEMAETVWRRSIMKLSVREIDENGELVATTTTSTDTKVDVPHTCELRPESFGTRYTPVTFPTLKLGESDGKATV